MRTGAACSRLVALSLCFISARAGGQEAAGARLGFMGVGVATTANPALFGERYTEAYLTQPNLMGEAWRGPLHFTGTLNFEGYTLRRGELNAGIYGESYVDRRHPHTLVHEAMLSVRSPAMRGVRASLSAGKGFTPYGTDDPMMRPLVKYPVNHHHAQIIERAVVTGALAYGDPVAGRGAAIEYGVFNGDEPTGPFAGPRWSRFGDSRSARLTVKPHARVEAQASRAFVRSPGIVQGGAFDHTQTSASVRYDRAPGGGMTHDLPDGFGYAMVEVARTDEGAGSTRAFRYESALAEGSYAWRGATLAARLESTERPESERLLDRFRTTNGHIDFQIIGVTRWRIATVGVTAPPLSLGRFGGTALSRITPFVEVARANAVARRRPAVFEPAEFYGNATQWSLSAGFRVHVGPMRARMGRYGVLDAAGASATHAGHAGR